MLEAVLSALLDATTEVLELSPDVLGTWLDVLLEISLDAVDTGLDVLLDFSMELLELSVVVEVPDITLLELLAIVLDVSSDIVLLETTEMTVLLEATYLTVLLEISLKVADLLVASVDTEAADDSTLVLLDALLEAVVLVSDTLEATL